MNKSYRIAEVALRVSDLEKASAFYEGVLGFTHHLELPGVLFLEVGALDSPLGEVGHPQLLALFERESKPDSASSTFDHIAFEVPHNFYDAELNRFSELGMVIRERTWPDTLPWNGRSFFLRDPDGNVVEFIAANEIKPKGKAAGS